MTTNKPEVYRVLGHRLHDDGPIEKLPYDWIRVIRLSDYEALQAECDHYKSAIAEITTRHFAERWVNAASNKELEQYLSDGIAQLEGEYRKQIEALQAERDAWHERAVMTLEKKNEWADRARKAESERNYLITETEKLRKRARTAEREHSKTLKTLKGLEKLAKTVSENSDVAHSENNRLRAECAQLRAAIRRLCNIYVVDDYYDGQLREERLEAAVNRAINAAMETTK